MSYYSKFSGEHICLSPIDANEVERYIKWMNDEAVAVQFGQYPNVVASKSDLDWIYDPPKNMQRYAIVLKDCDELIGGISIHNIDGLNRNAYIGVFIGEEAHRGKGLGAEAIRLILRYGFKTLNLHSINLTVHADNFAAISCYKKVGFREVGRLPEVFFVGGAYVDKIYMSMLEHEFSQ